MCGLAAIVDPAGSGVAAKIQAMTDLVRHRGPDDEGYMLMAAPGDPVLVLAGVQTPLAVRSAQLAHTPSLPFSPDQARTSRVALGHRRLSIVDLSPAGHQPMCSSDGSLWIVYNGEIYNHVELRAELEHLGHRFLSGSDTEVILAAWQHWGKACLARFNGMFAFVLVDRGAGRVHAVRDRFGVKPLYWWQAPQGFVAFASEIKQFSALPGWSARLDRQRAYDYLAWSLFDHTGHTLFDGVRQLRGGEMLELPLGQPPARIVPERWYTLRPREFSGTHRDAIAAFGNAFTDAVQLRLRADVDVGSCLSGGLDSSSIVCVADHLLRAQGACSAQKTFSAASREARFDERHYAEVVVAATGVDAHYVYPELEGALDALDRLTWHQDEPFGSSSIYAQWCVFQLAADQHVKVMLDGQGADELLAGYPGFLGPMLGGLLRRGQWLRLAQEIQGAGNRPGVGYGYAGKQLADRCLPQGLRHWLRRSAGRPSIAPGWLDVGRLGAEDREPFAEARQAAGSIADMSRLLLLETGVPMLLHTEDRNSMAHSVESRVPFLDYRLVELALGLPEDCKIRSGVAKRVLRDAMEGILPDVVRNRRDKLGFATAEEIWMTRSAPARFRAELAAAIDAAGGILRKSALTDFDEIVAGRRPFSFLPWRMISFGRWMRRFDVALQHG